MRLMLILVALTLASSNGPPTFPRTVHEVPQAFRGGWDEYDGCAGREPRYSIDRSRLFNFEVEWLVREVVLHSETDIDLVTILQDPDGGRTEEAIWSLRLVEGGRKLTGRTAGAPVYSRCRDTLQR
ncbi:MAG: hypothetical protein M3177_03070 [Pseudomonadota bacterium]|nr:hypothetical protein [Pseudomonadota bacterium]